MKQGCYWVFLAFGWCLHVDLQAERAEETVASQIPRTETGLLKDRLTGEWGGLRSHLLEKGLDLSAGYTGEVLGNVRGGVERGATYEGLVELAFDLRTDKLGWYQGGWFRASGLYPHGASLSQNAVGDLLTLSNIDAYDSFRLFELWYEQKVWDRVAVRVGQLAADEQFGWTETGADFLNSAFGWPAFISGNVPGGGPAYSFAAPGVSMRADITESVYLQAGVYDGDPLDNPSGDPSFNRHGTRFQLGAGQGWFSVYEAGLQWDKTLPGVLKMGGWYHTASFPDNLRDRYGSSFLVSGNEPLRHSGNFGGYIAVDQKLWSEATDPEQGLATFARLGASPENRNLFKWVFDGGFQYTGLIPGRDQDKVGVGTIYGAVSDDLRSHQREALLLNGERPTSLYDYEAVLEIYYLFQVKEWWTVQPDLQIIFHPGGSSANANAVVIGLRTSIVF